MIGVLLLLLLSQYVHPYTVTIQKNGDSNCDEVDGTDAVCGTLATALAAATARTQGTITLSGQDLTQAEIVGAIAQAIILAGTSTTATTATVASGTYAITGDGAITISNIGITTTSSEAFITKSGGTAEGKLTLDTVDIAPSAALTLTTVNFITITTGIFEVKGCTVGDASYAITFTSGCLISIGAAAGLEISGATTFQNIQSEDSEGSVITTERLGASPTFKITGTAGTKVTFDKCTGAKGAISVNLKQVSVWTDVDVQYITFTLTTPATDKGYIYTKLPYTIPTAFTSNPWKILRSDMQYCPVAYAAVANENLDDVYGTAIKDTITINPDAEGAGIVCTAADAYPRNDYVCTTLPTALTLLEDSKVDSDNTITLLAAGTVKLTSQNFYQASLPATLIVAGKGSTGAGASEVIVDKNSAMFVVGANSLSMSGIAFTIFNDDPDTESVKDTLQFATVSTGSLTLDSCTFTPASGTGKADPAEYAKTFIEVTGAGSLTITSCTFTKIKSSATPGNGEGAASCISITSLSDGNTISIGGSDIAHPTTFTDCDGAGEKGGVIIITEDSGLTGWSKVSFDYTTFSYTSGSGQQNIFINVDSSSNTKISARAPWIMDETLLEACFTSVQTVEDTYDTLSGIWEEKLANVISIVHGAADATCNSEGKATATIYQCSTLAAAMTLNTALSTNAVTQYNVVPGTAYTHETFALTTTGGTATSVTIVGPALGSDGTPTAVATLSDDTITINDQGAVSISNIKFLVAVTGKFFASVKSEGTLTLTSCCFGLHTITETTVDIISGESGSTLNIYSCTFDSIVNTADGKGVVSVTLADDQNFIIGGTSSDGGSTYEGSTTFVNCKGGKNAAPLVITGTAITATDKWTNVKVVNVMFEGCKGKDGESNEVDRNLYFSYTKGKFDTDNVWSIRTSQYVLCTTNDGTESNLAVVYASKFEDTITVDGDDAHTDTDSCPIDLDVYHYTRATYVCATLSDAYTLAQSRYVYTATVPTISVSTKAKDSAYAATVATITSVDKAVVIDGATLNGQGLPTTFATLNGASAAFVVGATSFTMTKIGFVIPESSNAATQFCTIANGGSVSLTSVSFEGDASMTAITQSLITVAAGGSLTLSGCTFTGIKGDGDLEAVCIDATVGDGKTFSITGAQNVATFDTITVGKTGGHAVSVNLASVQSDCTSTIIFSKVSFNQCKKDAVISNMQITLPGYAKTKWDNIIKGTYNIITNAEEEALDLSHVDIAIYQSDVEGIALEDLIGEHSVYYVDEDSDYDFKNCGSEKLPCASVGTVITNVPAGVSKITVIPKQDDHTVQVDTIKLTTNSLSSVTKDVTITIQQYDNSGVDTSATVTVTTTKLFVMDDATTTFTFKNLIVDLNHASAQIATVSAGTLSLYKFDVSLHDGITYGSTAITVSQNGGLIIKKSSFTGITSSIAASVISLGTVTSGHKPVFKIGGAEDEEVTMTGCTSSSVATDKGYMLLDLSAVSSQAKAFDNVDIKYLKFDGIHSLPAGTSLIYVKLAKDDDVSNIDSWLIPNSQLPYCTAKGDGAAQTFDKFYTITADSITVDKDLSDDDAEETCASALHYSSRNFVCQTIAKAYELMENTNLVYIPDYSVTLTAYDQTEANVYANAALILGSATQSTFVIKGQLHATNQVIGKLGDATGVLYTVAAKSFEMDDVKFVLDGTHKDTVQFATVTTGTLTLKRVEFDGTAVADGITNSLISITGAGTVTIESCTFDTIKSAAIGSVLSTGAIAEAANIPTIKFLGTAKIPTTLKDCISSYTHAGDPNGAYIYLDVKSVTSPTHPLSKLETTNTKFIETNADENTRYMNLIVNKANDKIKDFDETIALTSTELTYCHVVYADGSTPSTLATLWNNKILDQVFVDNSLDDSAVKCTKSSVSGETYYCKTLSAAYTLFTADPAITTGDNVVTVVSREYATADLALTAVGTQLSLSFAQGDDSAYATTKMTGTIFGTITKELSLSASTFLVSGAGAQLAVVGAEGKLALDTVIIDVDSAFKAGASNSLISVSSGGILTCTSVTISNVISTSTSGCVYLDDTSADATHTLGITFTNIKSAAGALHLKFSAAPSAADKIVTTGLSFSGCTASSTKGANAVFEFASDDVKASSKTTIIDIINVDLTSGMYTDSTGVDMFKSYPIYVDSEADNPGTANQCGALSDAETPKCKTIGAALGSTLYAAGHRYIVLDPSNGDPKTQPGEGAPTLPSGDQIIIDGKSKTFNLDANQLTTYQFSTSDQKLWISALTVAFYVTGYSTTSFPSSFLDVGGGAAYLDTITFKGEASKTATKASANSLIKQTAGILSLSKCLFDQISSSSAIIEIAPTSASTFSFICAADSATETFKTCAATTYVSITDAGVESWPTCDIQYVSFAPESAPISGTTKYFDITMKGTTTDALKAQNWILSPAQMKFTDVTYNSVNKATLYELWGEGKDDTISVDPTAGSDCTVGIHYTKVAYVCQSMTSAYTAYKSYLVSLDSTKNYIYIPEQDSHNKDKFTIGEVDTSLTIVGDAPAGTTFKSQAGLTGTMHTITGAGTVAITNMEYDIYGSVAATYFATIGGTATLKLTTDSFKQTSETAISNPLITVGATAKLNIIGCSFNGIKSNAHGICIYSDACPTTISTKNDNHLTTTFTTMTASAADKAVIYLKETDYTANSRGNVDNAWDPISFDDSTFTSCFANDGTTALNMIIYVKDNTIESRDAWALTNEELKACSLVINQAAAKSLYDSWSANLLSTFTYSANAEDSDCELSEDETAPADYQCSTLTLAYTLLTGDHIKRGGSTPYFSIPSGVGIAAASFKNDITNTFRAYGPTQADATYPTIKISDTMFDIKTATVDGPLGSTTTTGSLDLKYLNFFLDNTAADDNNKLAAIASTCTLDMTSVTVTQTRANNALSLITVADGGILKITTCTFEGIKTTTASTAAVIALTKFTAAPTIHIKGDDSGATIVPTTFKDCSSTAGVISMDVSELNTAGSLDNIDISYVNFVTTGGETESTVYMTITAPATPTLLAAKLFIMPAVQMKYCTLSGPSAQNLDELWGEDIKDSITLNVVAADECVGGIHYPSITMLGQKSGTAFVCKTIQAAYDVYNDAYYYDQESTTKLSLTLPDTTTGSNLITSQVAISSVTGKVAITGYGTESLHKSGADVDALVYKVQGGVLEVSILNLDIAAKSTDEDNRQFLNVASGTATLTSVTFNNNDDLILTKSLIAVSTGASFTATNCRFNNILTSTDADIAVIEVASCDASTTFKVVGPNDNGKVTDTTFFNCHGKLGSIYVTLADTTNFDNVRVDYVKFEQTNKRADEQLYMKVILPTTTTAMVAKPWKLIGTQLQYCATNSVTDTSLLAVYGSAAYDTIEIDTDGTDIAAYLYYGKKAYKCATMQAALAVYSSSSVFTNNKYVRVPALDNDALYDSATLKLTTMGNIVISGDAKDDGEFTTLSKLDSNPMYPVAAYSLQVSLIKYSLVLSTHNGQVSFCTVTTGKLTLDDLAFDVFSEGVTLRSNPTPTTFTASTIAVTGNAKLVHIANCEFDSLPYTTDAINTIKVTSATKSANLDIHDNTFKKLTFLHAEGAPIYFAIETEDWNAMTSPINTFTDCNTTYTPSGGSETTEDRAIYLTMTNEATYNAFSTINKYWKLGTALKHSYVAYGGNVKTLDKVWEDIMKDVLYFDYTVDNDDKCPSQRASEDPDEYKCNTLTKAYNVMTFDLTYDSEAQNVINIITDRVIEATAFTIAGITQDKHQTVILQPAESQVGGVVVKLTGTHFGVGSSDKAGDLTINNVKFNIAADGQLATVAAKGTLVLDGVTIQQDPAAEASAYKTTSKSLIAVAAGGKLTATSITFTKVISSAFGGCIHFTTTADYDDEFKATALTFTGCTGKTGYDVVIVNGMSKENDKLLTLYGQLANLDITYDAMISQTGTTNTQMYDKNVLTVGGSDAADSETCGTGASGVKNCATITKAISNSLFTNKVLSVKLAAAKASAKVTFDHSFSVKEGSMTLDQNVAGAFFDLSSANKIYVQGSEFSFTKATTKSNDAAAPYPTTFASVGNAEALMNLTDVTLKSQLTATEYLMTTVIKHTAGLLYIYGCTFDSITLGDAPLLSLLPTTVTGKSASNSITFSSIERTTGSGSVFALEPSGENAVLNLTDMTFTSCKVSADEAVGGAIYVKTSVYVQPIFTNTKVTVGDATSGKFIFFDVAADTNILFTDFMDFIESSKLADEAIQYKLTAGDDQKVYPISNLVRDITVNTNTKDNNDKTSCGSTDVPCSTINFAVKSDYYTKYKSRNLKIGSVSAESESSTITRTLNLVGSGSVTSTLASGTLLTVTGSGTVGEVILTVTSISFTYGLPTGKTEGTGATIIKATAKASIVLTGVSITGTSSIAVSPSVLDVTTAGLTMENCSMSSIAMKDACAIAPNVTKDGLVMKGMNTFTSITRSSGSGAVFEVTVGADNAVVLSNANFKSCGVTGGNGGAISVTISAGTISLKDMTFDTCSAASTKEGEGCGGALYMAITGTPSMTFDALAFTSCTASSGSCVMLKLDAELTADTMSTYSYFINQGREPGKFQYTFVDKDSKTQTKDLFDYVPTQLYVKKSGKGTAAKCGQEDTDDSACATLFDALSSYGGTINVITISGEAYDKVSSTAVIDRDMSITGAEGTALTLAPASTTAKYAFTIGTGYLTMTATLSTVAFTVDYSSDLGMFIVKSGATLSLTSVKVTGSATAALSVPFINAAEGTLNLKDATVEKVTLDNAALITMTPNKITFDGSNAITDITRKTGDGSVFVTSTDSTTNLAVKGVVFTNCKVENGNGGALSVTYAKGNFSLGEANQTKDTSSTKFVNCSAGSTASMNDGESTNGKGGGMYLVVNEAPEDGQALTIGSVVFEGCNSTDGGAMYAKAESDDALALLEGDDFWIAVTKVSDSGDNQFKAVDKDEKEVEIKTYSFPYWIIVIAVVIPVVVIIIVVIIIICCCCRKGDKQ